MTGAARPQSGRRGPLDARLGFLRAGLEHGAAPVWELTCDWILHSQALVCRREVLGPEPRPPPSPRPCGGGARPEETGLPGAPAPPFLQTCTRLLLPVVQGQDGAGEEPFCTFEH